MVASTTVNLNTMLTLQYRMNKALEQMDKRIKRVNTSLQQIDKVSLNTDSLKEYGKTLATVLSGVTKFLEAFEKSAELSKEIELIKLGQKATGRTTNRSQEAGPIRDKTGKPSSKKARKSKVDKLIERYNLNNVEDEIKGSTKPVKKPSLIGRAKSKLQDLDKQSYLGWYEKVAGTGSKTISKLGKAGKLAGKFIKPIDYAAKVIEFATAEDKVKAGGKIAGGIAGGSAGAIAGAAIGTAILPGVGTVIGGYLGNLAGDKIGSYLAGKAVDKARENPSKAAGGAIGAAIGTAVLPGIGTAVGGYLGASVGQMAGRQLSSQAMGNVQQSATSVARGVNNVVPIRPRPSATAVSNTSPPANQTFNINVTVNSQADTERIADEVAQKIAREVGKAVQNRAKIA